MNPLLVRHKSIVPPKSIPFSDTDLVVIRLIRLIHLIHLIRLIRLHMHYLTIKERNV